MHICKGTRLSCMQGLRVNLACCFYLSVAISYALLWRMLGINVRNSFVNHYCDKIQSIVLVSNSALPVTHFL